MAFIRKSFKTIIDRERTPFERYFGLLKKAYGRKGIEYVKKNADSLRKMTGILKKDNRVNQCLYDYIVADENGKTDRKSAQYLSRKDVRYFLDVFPLLLDFEVFNCKNAPHLVMFSKFEC